ncbi:lipase 1 [Manduca sexta]|uniref:lipase 1 n=1 Tax=Manduca sexta TaxID=7130 RepID=UPI00188F6A60|nr:lipase 1 [Manduca sexta]
MKEIIILTSLLANLVLQVAPELAEDGRLDFTGLANKYGYTCEEHNVTTEDGYILKLFHVPGSSSRPILLMHGIIDSADTFIIRGNKSLVAVLASRGYDIWVGNVRGTQYSRAHTQLDPDKNKEFWDYSYHELGYYDLPAIIDYILSRTNADKLNAIGHSQGNSIFFVLGSTKPEYNDKVNLLIALAPVGYLTNLPPPWSFITRAGNVLNEILIALDTDELFNKQLRTVVQDMCSVETELCASMLGELGGPDAEELEPAFIPVLIGHYPISTSRKNGEHLVQNAMDKKFCKFDYGSKTNMEIYGQKSPPDYDLRKVTMKVALYGSRNDRLVPVANMKLLEKELANVVEFRIIKRRQFNHMDHVWGRNMDKHLFPHVLKTLEKYN